MEIEGGQDSDWCCLTCVHTKEVAIVENLGNFDKLLSPGLHFYIPIIQNVVGRLSLRIQQLDVTCETKTKDNVFVQVAVSVQFRIVEDGAYAAYYRLTNPTGQIKSYVFDVIRSTVPRLELDTAFESKKDIADSVKKQLKDAMKDYGYEIINTLVTDLSPDSKVKASMNEINASKRLKEASAHKAEAAKVKQIKAAEAEAEARYLSGMGVARQRKAIVSGLKESVEEFSDKVDEISSKDVMDILLLSQYFDTLTAVGANTLFVQHDPSTVSHLQGALGGSFQPKPKTTKRALKNKKIG